MEKSLLPPAGIKTPDRRQLDTWRYGTDLDTWVTVRREARDIWYRDIHVRYGRQLHVATLCTKLDTCVTVRRDVTYDMKTREIRYRARHVTYGTKTRAIPNIAQSVTKKSSAAAF